MTPLSREQRIKQFLLELDKEQRVEQFLLKLADLTRTYGIGSAGCGCCCSPWLDTEANVSDPRFHYHVNAANSYLKWVPDDEQK